MLAKNCVTINRYAGLIVELTNPQIFYQTKGTQHSPQCGDNVDALGWGVLMSHAMVPSQSRQTPWSGVSRFFPGGLVVCQRYQVG